MPYPNEHACRLNDPGKYDRMRRNNCAEKHEGKCIDVIYGVKDEKAEIQALRYPKDVWEAGAARSHCSGRSGSFEAASEKEAAEVERKTVTLKGLKLDDTGAFKALFAPYDSVDKQGDMTLRGAFGEHQRVIISAYGHGSWTGALPVGKGFIHDGKDGGEVEGQFFLNTIAGKDTYTIVKELGDLQEWSYALPDIDFEVRTIDDRTVRVLKRITVNEVSPVLMGAGNGTRTLAIKGVLSFAEQMEKVTMSAEDALERLKGRVAMRESEFHAPKASDLERARELKTRLEGLALKLGEIIQRHDAFSEALGRFEKVTKKGE
jgi:hypothetical protein